VELPKSHPFQRRCLHCSAELSAVLRQECETAEVMMSIREMEFQPLTPELSRNTQRSAGPRRTRGGAGTS